MYFTSAWSIAIFLAVVLASLLFLSWLFGGRKLVAASSQPTLPVTFIAPRFIPIFVSLFAVPATAICYAFLVDVLFVENGRPTRERVLLLAIALFASFVMSAIAWLYGVGAILPDHLTLSDAGIWCRIRGHVWQWSWNEIHDVKLAGPAHGVPVLMLRQADPDRARFLRRLPWKTDASQVPLGNNWKPAALLTSGQMAVYDAIRVALEAHRERKSMSASRQYQPMTAQASG